MKKYLLLTIQVMVVFLFASNVFAFDDKTTHPAITKAAGSGRVTGIAPRNPPTPPDMRFSASGD